MSKDKHTSIQSTPLKRLGKSLLKWTAIALLAFLFIGTFMFLYRKSQPRTVKYEINTPSVQDIQRTTVVTGKIEPRDEVNIKPQISGIIAELYKEAGQMVHKDEVIAKVKVIPDMGSLSSAENRVELAEISLAQARTDYERTERLHKEQVVSDTEFEQAQVKYRQAQEELKSAKDALNIVREGISLSNAQMSTTLIRSTIDGLILDIPVKVGNSVILSNSFNDGTTIATVANMQDLIFKGKIDETEVGRLSEGMPVSITIGALPGTMLNATLEYIAPKGTEENGASQFEIKAAIQIPEGVQIRSGYSANGEIILQSSKQALTIPEASLSYENDSTYVYVLTKTLPNGSQQFERRTVTTGISNGIDIEILSGVKKVDKIRGIEIIEDL